MNIFCDKQDYEFFLNRLSENLVGTVGKGKMGTYTRKTVPQGSFDLVAYCLMPNHFHLLLRQNTDLSISKLVSKISTSFSKYFNLKYDRVGSVFQDQFKSVVVESDAQLRWLVEYIHQNPVKAGITSRAENYLYSSSKNIMMMPIINKDFVSTSDDDYRNLDITFIAIDEL
jgi:REP element-mobilizing transposase RayT